MLSSCFGASTRLPGQLCWGWIHPREQKGRAEQASPAAVSRHQLEYALWGDEPPDGDMLRSHIYELRRSVDGGQAVKLIHTIPRVGYRIAVERAADAPAQ